MLMLLLGSQRLTYPEIIFLGWGALRSAPHGIMIAVLAPNDVYFTHIVSLLGATGSKGWARAPILALAPDPTFDFHS